MSPVSGSKRGVYETMRPMRTLILCTAILLTTTSVAEAQLADRAILATPAGQEPITIVQQGGVLFLPIDRIVTSLGGSFERSEGDFTIQVDQRRASFRAGDLVAVAGEDLIEMGGTPPVVIESRPFVPLRFVRDFLRPVELEPVWSPETSTLEIRPLRREAVHVETTVTTVDQLTKIVFELSRESTFSISRRATSYVVQFRNPIRAAETEIAVDNPLVSRITFGPSSAEVILRTPQVAADAYKLDNPARVVLDLKRTTVSPDPPPAPAPLRPSRTAPSGVNTIVIDPGHGGREVGAKGPGGALEKDLTLQISRRLRDSLAAKGFRVILTRNEDVLLEHDQRTAIANQYHADLFLSVHLNAVPFGTAEGPETYFLSLEATDDRARLSAERENTTGGVPRPTGSDIDLILWDLAQQRYLKESSRFAELVQDEMAQASGVERRGVKQAPFRVLLGAMMPAVLVEIGFISNPREESRLQSADYQQQVATALAEAVLRYKSETETRVGHTRPQQAPDAAAEPSADTAAESLRSES
jgi:N-acetylmuramoyl-L-alanine amidase